MMGNWIATVILIYQISKWFIWVLHVQLLTKTALQTLFRSLFLILSFSYQVLAFFFLIKVFFLKKIKK